MSSPVFITGGGGFFAPHLIRALGGGPLVQVHLRRESERLAEDLPDCVVLREPLTDPTLADRLEDGTDTVFHLAGAVTTDSAMDLINANVVTTANVIELMVRRGIPHLVFLSTAAVWSGATGGRIDEDVPPAPTTPYGFAKLAAEALVVDAVARGKIASATILRCNNTYGPGSRQGVVANFYHRIRVGQGVLIDGDGMQLREPLFVADLMDLLLRARNRPSGLQVYGISGPEAMTVSDIAFTVAEVTGRELKIDWGADRSDRSRHLLISTDKVKAGLNWQPTTCLADGLRAMLAAEC